MPLSSTYYFFLGRGGEIRNYIQGFSLALKPIVKLRLGPSLLLPLHLWAPLTLFRGQGWDMDNGKGREYLCLVLKQKGCLLWHSAAVDGTGP